MEGEALAARRKGLNYKGAAQLKAMRAFEGQMKALSKMAESAPADRKPEIRQRQIELARRAMEVTSR
jgi:hypothetical protein